MSQASKHVKWCIEKAKKEIEECKRLGKRPKYRGLVEVGPDIEAVKKHLEKAEHNLKATEFLRKGKFSDISASTVFYSMYHCFLAIARKLGYESKNQTCTITLIEWLKEEGKIYLDSKFIDLLKSDYSEEQQVSTATDIREEYTYGSDISIKDETKIENLIKECKELIYVTKEIVFK